MGLNEDAYKKLHRKIVRLELEPGSVYSEPYLSELIGIGRTPVREALARLALEHLVKILPRNGAMVTEVDTAKQLKTLELRRVLVGLVVEKAAAASNNEQKSKLQCLSDAAADGLRMRDVEKYFAADGEIKAILSQLANNEFVKSALWVAESLSRRYWYKYSQVGNSIPFEPAYRAAVVKAIIDGNTVEALRCHNVHFDHLEECTRESLMAL